VATSRAGWSSWQIIVEPILVGFFTAFPALRAHFTGRPDLLAAASGYPVPHIRLTAHAGTLADLLSEVDT
jgi:hypothetical protein